MAGERSGLDAALAGEGMGGGHEADQPVPAQGQGVEPGVAGHIGDDGHIAAMLQQVLQQLG